MPVHSLSWVIDIQLFQRISQSSPGLAIGLSMAFGVMILTRNRRDVGLPTLIRYRSKTASKRYPTQSPNSML